jgi:hypothetical protein
MYIFLTFLTFLSSFKSSGEHISYETLSSVLTTEGEAFTDTELKSCMQALVGVPRTEQITKEGDYFAPSHFADEVLGFEDFAEQQE